MLSNPRAISFVIAAFTASLALATGWPGSIALHAEQAPGVVWQAATDPPPPPPGTERIINYDRQGSRLAACAQRPGPAVQQGARRLPLSEVWITDGVAVWKTSMGPVTCDPAWSPGGDRLAITTLDGLWILSGPQQKAGEQLVDTRTAAQPTGKTDSVSIAKPKWSPNGARIAYVASNGGTSWVEVVDVVGGRALFKSAPETYAFVWGADSRSLVIGGNNVRIP